MRRLVLRLLTVVAILIGVAVPAGPSASAATPCGPATVDIGDITQAPGSGGTTPFEFPVTVSAAAGCGAAGSVGFHTMDGSPADHDPATAGSDYVAVSGIVSWQGDTATRYVTVPVIGDPSPDLREVFWVQLDSPSGVIIRHGSGAGWIDPGVNAGMPAPVCPPNCSAAAPLTGMCWSKCDVGLSLSSEPVVGWSARVVASGNGPFVPVDGVVLTGQQGDRRLTLEIQLLPNPNRQPFQIVVQFSSTTLGKPGNLTTTVTVNPG
ncbi:MAG TPA: hypothetical protein VH352_27650 [Pseudonocardiaceae bacterium]|jgi:hypothetical protein|nr:hypothetical protein [Pseudonocardiaceae bacterium]